MARALRHERGANRSSRCHRQAWWPRSMPVESDGTSGTHVDAVVSTAWVSRRIGVAPIAHPPGCVQLSLLPGGDVVAAWLATLVHLATS